MATLREIQLRLKSVQNISKITKSMKMIASTKLTRAQKAMEVARVYGNTSQQIFQSIKNESPEEPRKLVITSSSDRGLCGGIHSTISKATRNYLRENPNNQLVILGDKAKSQLSKEFKRQIELTFNQIGKSVPTFLETCGIILTLMKYNVEFDQMRIFYNKFNSVISFEANVIEVPSLETFKNSEHFTSYEIDSSVLENFIEFSSANALHWAFVEGYASEQAAKRSAMENATKNAGEVIDKLTLTYNRGRQAAITNDLVDIITGASAL